MLHCMPGMTVVPKPSQGQSRVECGHSRLPSRYLASLMNAAILPGYAAVHAQGAQG